MFNKKQKPISFRFVLALVLITSIFSIPPVQASAKKVDGQLDNGISPIAMFQNNVSFSSLLSATPAYSWHTFYESGDTADSTVDSSGNIYLVGYSGLTWDGPDSTPPLNGHAGGAEIVIVKLNSAGVYQWHTFYGSINNDTATSVAIDNEGNVYIAGGSDSAWDGPGSIPPLNDFTGEGDMVLIKLNSSGAYQWHTFYGPNSTKANDVTLDSNGNIYVVGYSGGTWDGTGSSSPLNSYTGSSDIVVVKLNNSGIYQWHTFYGSSDGANSVSVDNNGDIYVAGGSNASWNGPNSETPRHPHTGDSWGDIVILKLNSSGGYQWHTFYGAYGTPDYPRSIDVDTRGNIYIAGGSNASWNGPNKPPLNPYAGGTADIVVLKLNNSGDYQWHTFYGSTASDSAYSIDANTNGEIFVAGASTGAWNGPGSIPPLNPFTTSPFGLHEIAVLELNSSGAYQWHTFYGSSNVDVAYGINATLCGTYITGTSRASWNGPSNTPPLNPAGSLGSFNMFVVKMSGISSPKIVTNVNDIGAGSLRQAIADACPGDTITFATSLAGQTITLASTLNINKDLMINGSALASKVIISGNNTVRVFDVTTGAIVNLNGLIITKGRATEYDGSIVAGGIRNLGNLTITNSTITNNVADKLSNGNGGGIHNLGELTIANSAITNNTAYLGGGIMNMGESMQITDSIISNNIGGEGAGIYVVSTLDLVNSTVFNNSADRGGGIVSTGVINIVNSTFWGNSSNDEGGGILNYGPLTITSSTFSDNSAVTLGGGIYNGNGPLNLTNSIIANSTSGGDCYNDTNVNGVMGVDINNLVESNAASPNNCGSPTIAADPLLGPLTNNGGFAPTMALDTGSPAIDAGNDTNCPATDQRGMARPQGVHCDMGAYEYKPLPPGAFNKSLPNNNVLGQSINPTLNWETSTGAVSYEYCYDATNDNACSSWINVGASTSQALSGLNPNATYYWHVRAVNSDGVTYSNGSNTAFWMFKTGGLAGAFSKSSPASGSIKQPTNPTLKWAVSTGAVGYEYCIDTVDNNTCDTAWVNTTAASASLSGLVNNTTYYWQVRAFNAIGTVYSNGGTWWNFKVVLSAPSLVTPNEGDHLFTLRPTFDWEDVVETGVTNYTIQISTSSTFATIANTGSPVSSSYTPTVDLPKGKLYWRVRTNGTNGPSAWSTRSYQGPYPLPTPVLSLPANNALLTDYTPQFKWSALTIPASAAAFDKYQLQVATDAGFTSLVLEQDVPGLANNTFTPATDLASNTKYYWRVRGVNTLPENGNWSVVWSFRTALLPVTLNALQNGDHPYTLRPTFTWNDPNSAPLASGYYLQIATSNTFATLVMSGTAPAGATSYVPTINLPGGKLLYWRVRANGLNGPSLWTSGFFTTPTPPSVPTLLLPANTSLNTTYTPTLKWSAVTSVVAFNHYQVQVDDDPLFLSPEVDDSTHTLASQNQLTTPALSPNTKFYWRVLAFNNNGQYSTSAVWSFRTALLPVSVNALQNGDHPYTLRPTFSWNDPNLAAPLATGYTIQIATSNTFATLVTSGTTTAGITSFLPTINLPAGKLLYWRVRANGVNGPSLWTLGSFTTPTPPSVATLLLPANTSLNTNYTPTLKWSAVTSVIAFHHYQVQVDDDPLFLSPAVDDVTHTLASQNQLTTPSLPHNVKFYWRVLAFNNDGQYSTSAVWSFRTALLPVSLNTLQNGDHPYTLRPTFTWNDLNLTTPLASGYYLQIASVSNFSTLLTSGTTLTGVTSFTPTINLPAGKLLYWRVRANGVNGPSLWTLGSFTTPNPPSVPTLLLPANTSLNTNYTPTLKWSVVTSVIGFHHYQVQVDDDPLFLSPDVDDSTHTLASQNLLTTPSLPHNVKFYWRVLAFNNDGQYSTSAVWSFRTIIDAPVLVSPGNGTPAGTLKPVFDWDAPSGPVTSYTLQVATSPTFATLLVNSTTVDSTYTRLTNFPAGKTLYWRVRANGVNGPSAWSSTFSFTTP